MASACLATLCELAIQNREVGSYSGVIAAIISSTLDCALPRMNESLISTVLYLFNYPKYRCYVRRKVCTPFVAGLYVCMLLCVCVIVEPPYLKRWVIYTWGREKRRPPFRTQACVRVMGWAAPPYFSRHILQIPYSSV